MKINRFNDASPYHPPAHEDVAALRLMGDEVGAGGFATVALSHYLPGGNAEMSAGPTQKIYVIVAGELAIEMADGTRDVLRPLDTCFLDALDRREVRNETNGVTSMLVITPMTPAS